MTPPKENPIQEQILSVVLDLQKNMGIAQRDISKLKVGQERMEGRQDRMENNIAVLQKDVTELKGGFTELKGGLAELKVGQERMEMRQERMEMRQERMERIMHDGFADVHESITLLAVRQDEAFRHIGAAVDHEARIETLEKEVFGTKVGAKK